MASKKENAKGKKEKEKAITPGADIGYVKDREIIAEMRESYIDYAMSVIVARALPDVRDGLKPVQRRILYSMNEIGLTYGSKFRKSAAVIGDVLAKYHPHGDASVYDALARMAQDFSLRYPLVQGQGNFGSIDGDPPAAYRYTEARLSKISSELLKDIERDTVDLIDNYDGSKQEPTVLPGLLPGLLLNGSLGIAVGMATNIPPHNLGEVCDAAVYLLENPKASTEDLFQFIKGPDFPTGGIIFDQKEIIAAYSHGKGPILMRGKAEITEDKNDKVKIVITEIPFQVNKSSLVEQFAHLVEEKRVVGIRDIRDESGKEGIRIVLYLNKDVPPQKILNQLYKYSDLQKSFHLNMIALVDGIQPKVLSLAEVLHYYLEHRKNVVTRRTQYDLKKAKEREHILEGLHKCLGNIDKVIKIIRESKSREDAQINLMKAFALTEIQANAVLETKLAHLARLERLKIEEELKAIKAKIAELEAILKDPKKIQAVMKKEILGLKEAFGDERKTRIMARKIQEFSDEDLIPEEEVVITLTNSGYIKRINPETYRLQKRGGKGTLGMKTVGEDVVEHFITANTHDSLLFFSDSGKVFRAPAYEIPEGSRVAKGRALVNFLEITTQEKIMSVLAIKKQDFENKDKYLMMATDHGIVKKTLISEFQNMRKTGLIALNLKKGDSLKSVRMGDKGDEVILITKVGKSIRFSEKQVRPMGRPAAGIKGISLKKDDKVISMDLIRSKTEKGQDSQNYIIVLSENGYGKMTKIKDFRIQSRGGSGIKVSQTTPKTGQMACAQVLSGEEEELIVISQKGQVIRTPISSIPKLSRVTQGVRIMRLEPGEKVAKMASL
ncbi:MAG TPA: DNA gyrase subunit A [Candidatus Pacearchaeota archaeon]|nr:DNA gyrase subunit A [Candidatus Pacearchaeota archaeon]HOU45576.1 DNA gyrase subunit A [Candidatus Pacearchaeota archaeon]HPM08439.1 DNA gyrase subunit A [Candidatus Pacearchaeota archaeon]HQI74267.1 DNA gyrase subunit A [Candidatus Pacearchaeota archaeon]